LPDTTTIKQLLEAGAHFGHQTSRWHPRMKSYIFTKRNGIHIIDLEQTGGMLDKACNFVREVTAEGGRILFVGTKKQAQEAVEEEAKRCGMYYVNQRWLGGVLTNFTTIQARIDHLVRLEDQQERGEFKQYQNSPYRKLYEENTLYETYPNWPSCAYPCALENRGVIGNYRTIPFESYAIPAESEYYRGEAWIKEMQGKIMEQEITPNKIRIKTNGLGRNLVINQNFQPGWRSEARVFSMNGRLAVALSPGQTEVELTFRPATFLWGSLISLASLALTLYVMIRGTRHRKGAKDVSK